MYHYYHLVVNRIFIVIYIYLHSYKLPIYYNFGFILLGVIQRRIYPHEYFNSDSKSANNAVTQVCLYAAVVVYTYF